MADSDVDSDQSFTPVHIGHFPNLLSEQFTAVPSSAPHQRPDKRRFIDKKVDILRALVEEDHLYTQLHVSY
jgi:hypothetical protein